LSSAATFPQLADDKMNQINAILGINLGFIEILDCGKSASTY